MNSLKTPIVKHRLKNATGFFMLAVLLFAITGCNPPRFTLALGEENQGWEMAKIDKNDNPSWIIFRRKIVGTDFLEYKIEGTIQSSPKVCLAAFKQDILNQAEDPKNKKYPTYEISEVSKDCLSTYVIHNEPFPLKDTEMSVRYIFYNDENGDAGVKWNEAWDECPVQPSKKLKRVETFRGSWNFSPTANHSSKVINSVQFDPQKMPLWLVEPMVFNFFKKGLENLREMTAEY